MRLLAPQVAVLPVSPRRDGNASHFRGIGDETSRTAGSGAASLTAEGTEMLLISEGSVMRLLAPQVAVLPVSPRRDGNASHFRGIGDETSRTAGSGAASLIAEGTEMLFISEGVA